MDFHPQKSFAYGTLYSIKIIQKLSLEVDSAIEM